MARSRTYTVEFKRQVVEERLGGGTSLNRLAHRHDISRELLRTGEEIRGRGPGGRPTTPDRRAYEAKIAGLERKVGQLTMELDWTCSKRGSARHAGRAAGPPPS